MGEEMNIRTWIEENYPDETILLADGFDRAFMGVGRIFNGPAIAVYDSSMCITMLRESGMTQEEAEDYFGYNVIGSYVGEKTPMFVESPRWKRGRK